MNALSGAGDKIFFFMVVNDKLITITVIKETDIKNM